MSRTDTAAERSLADAEHGVYWTDHDAGEPRGELVGRACADLVVVGGGLTGLWSAILAKQQRPDQDVVLLEARRIAHGGSGRNGGFLSDSLTHGLAHGAYLWPGEIGRLLTLGRDNLHEIAEFVRAEGIDADLRLCGRSSVATEPHQVGELRDEADLYGDHGVRAVFQGAGGIRADVHSETYKAGIRFADSGGLVDPVRLTRGLASIAERMGVRIHEHSEVRAVRDERERLVVRTPQGTVHCAGAVLGTSAFPAPLKGIRRYVLPLWDYVLVTEPLSAAQWESVGWRDGQGIVDAGNRFHYYRPVPDGGILWGGYDAVYYFGGRVDSVLSERKRVHRRLAEQFFHTFPQLEGLRFTHRWGGAIDSTSRGTPVFGTACSGRVSYAVGYTGMGVAVSRFGAQVALDLLHERNTELSSLAMVRDKPMRFPPEPVRWPLVMMTQYALNRADERQGSRGPWLRYLDRHGLGVSS